MTLLLWLHLVGGIVVTGLALFWAILGRSVGRVHDPVETNRLLQVAAGARWPHVVVPWKLRLPLPLLAAAALVVVALLGFLLPASYGAAMLAKLAASLGLLLCFVALGRRPTPMLGYATLGYAALALALIATALSALIGR
jgi:hypothetical protein